MFVAIDRTSTFAFAKLVEKAGKRAAAQFLHEVVEALPCRVHTVLTDNGVQFINRPQDHHAMEHIFGRACREHGIEHRLTKVNHPWTTDEIEQPLSTNSCYFLRCGRPRGEERGVRWEPCHAA